MSGSFTTDFSIDFETPFNLNDTTTTSDSYLVTKISLTLFDNAATIAVYAVSAVSESLGDTAVSSDVYVGAQTLVADSAVTTEIYLTSFASSGASPWTTDFTGDFGSGTGTVTVTLLDNVIDTDAFSVLSPPEALADSAASSELLTGVSKSQFSLSDSAVCSDVLAVIAALRTLADSAVTSSSETLSNLVAALATDTVLTAESYVLGNAAYIATLSSDTANTTDSLTKLSFAAILADSGVTTESIASSMSASYDPWTSDFSVDFGSGGAQPGTQTQNDVLVVSESLTGTATSSPTGFSDAVASSDFYAYPVTATLNDNITNSDILNAVDTEFSFLSDSALSSDTLSSAAPIGLLSDSNSTFDTFTFVLAKTSSWLDSGTTSEVYAAQYVLTGSPADNPTLSESLTPSFFIPTNAVTDTTISSEFYYIVIFVTNFGDNTVSSDSISTLANKPVSLVDSAITSDSYAVSSSSLSLADTLASSETQVGLGANSVALTEPALAGSDIYATPSLGLTAILGDPVTVTESISVTSGGQTSVVFTDVILISTDLSGTVALAPVSVFDSSSTFGLFGVAGSTYIFSDQVASSDNYAISGVSLTVIDAAAITENLIGQNANLFSFSDINNSTDGLSIPSFGLRLDDSSVASENLIELVSGISAIMTDAIASSDLYVGNKGFPAALVDILGDSDLWSPPRFGYLLGLSDTLSDQDQWSTQGASTLASTTLMAIPTGGAVLLRFEGYFPLPLQPRILTIERSVSGTEAWVTLYRGPPLGVFIDVGDSLPQTLDASTSYLWRVSDNSGTVTLGPLMPSPSFFTSSPV